MPKVGFHMPQNHQNFGETYRFHGVFPGDFPWKRRWIPLPVRSFSMNLIMWRLCTWQIPHVEIAIYIVYNHIYIYMYIAHHHQTVHMLSCCNMLHIYIYICTYTAIYPLKESQLSPTVPQTTGITCHSNHCAEHRETDWVRFTPILVWLD